MAHRFVDETLALKPGRGPLVQIPNAIRLGATQFGAQQFAEEVVIAIPATRHVQRHQKQVFAIDLLQDRGRIGRLQHRVAQLTTESSQDRGAQQKAAQVRRLTVEHLGHQVVDDMTVVACERPDKRRGIGTPGQ